MRFVGSETTAVRGGNASSSWEKAPVQEDQQASTGRRIAGNPFSLVGLVVILFLVRPVSDNLTTGVILLLGTWVSVLSIVIHGWRASRQMTTAWAIALFGCGTAVAWGAAQANPGWASEAVFFVALPTVFFLFITAGGHRQFGSILAAIPIGLTVASALSLSYWLSIQGVFSGQFSEYVDLGFGVGYEGLANEGEGNFGFEVRSYSISSLVFALPFVLGTVVFNLRFANTMSNMARWPALILGVSFLLLSGRRAIMLSVVLVCVALIVWRVVVVRRHRRSDSVRLVRTLGFTLFFVGLAFVGSGFRVGDFIESTASDLSSGVRAEQHTVLQLLLSERPLFGHGFGFVAPAVTRDYYAPWRFELQYDLILTAMGLIGVLFLLLPTGYLLYKAVSQAWRTDDSILVVTFAGTLSLLLANATNPYLHTPGHYWMFYLLVFAVDLSLRKHPGWVPSSSETRRRT